MEEDMAQRLRTLEGTLEIQQDYLRSLKHLLFHTTEALHRKGLVRMQEIASSAEQEDAYARMSFGAPKMEVLPALVEAMRSLGDALDEAKTRGS